MDKNRQTYLVICASRHHGVYHLAGVVDAGDSQLPQRACELDCGKQVIAQSSAPVLSPVVCHVEQMIFC